MISREKMIALYSAMVKYRALATHTGGKISRSWQLTPGLEATVAAITADLRPDDAFTATQSKLASAFINRTTPNRSALDHPSLQDNLFAAFNSAHAKNGHVSPSMLAKEFSSALASATALKMAKSDSVALLFCEIRVPADLWRTHLQSASGKDLPIVFVRLAAPSLGAHTAPAAFSFGVPHIAVDAHDVLAVYRVASESVARARHRRGPTLIECVDFTPSDERRSATDAIAAIELHLTKKRILNASLKQKIETGIARELNQTLRAPLS